MNRYLAQKKEVFDLSKFTVVGSPTITSDGVASGFSASNYITQNITFTPNSFTEWTCKFTTGSDITSNQYVWRFYNKLTGEWCTNAVGVYNGVIRILYKDGTWLAYTCSPNTTYIVKVRYTSTNATAYIYNENKELLQTLTYSGTIPFMMGENSLFSVGIVYDSKVSYWLGSIDLKELSIVVDGKEVSTGTKPVHLLERRKDGFDLSKFTVVGSPTITDNGILSNCSNGNAVNTQVQLSQLAGKSWSIKGSVVLGEATHTLVKLSSVGNGNYTALGSVLWTASSKLIGFNCRTGTPENKSSDGTKISTSNNFANVGEKVYYTLSFDINTGTYSLYVDKVGGTTLIGTWTATSTNKELYYINTQPAYYISLGTGSDNQSYLTTGSIDLSQFQVTVDGKEIFSGAKKAYYVLRR